MTISFIRTLLLYILIIGAVRLMGKRQISEMQTSELVVTLLISDIAAIPMQDTGRTFSERHSSHWCAYPLRNRRFLPDD